jgi:hypothetical protein
MADTLLEANQAAHQARAAGADQLNHAVLAQIRNHYLGALAKGRTDNHKQHSTLAGQGRQLIQRFTRYEDMILRFTVDLTLPFTNNCAERAVRPVKVHNAPLAEVGAPCKDSSTSRSCTPTSTPPPNGASTNSKHYANYSPPAHGYHQPSHPAEQLRVSGYVP